MRSLSIFLLFILQLICLSARPQATLVPDHTRICAGQSINFNMQLPTPVPAQFTLFYGNGFSSLNPQTVSSYIYTTPGWYQPYLIIPTSPNSADTVKSLPIQVLALPISKFNILSSDTLCFFNNVLEIINLSEPGLSAAPINRVIWQLNNGFLIDTQVVYGARLSYHNDIDVKGVLYDMVLEVSDTNGCVSRIEKNDSVLLLPQILPVKKIMIDFRCDTTIVKFKNITTADTSTIKSFRWIFDDGYTDTANWAEVIHSYTKTGIWFNPQLEIISKEGCWVGSSRNDSFQVITYRESPLILPSTTQCYNNNEFNISVPYTDQIKWQVFDEDGRLIDSVKVSAWVHPNGFKAKNCGRFRLRLEKGLLNCVYIYDTFLFVNGPKAIISNDSVKVYNGSQCVIKDTVRFVDPNPYLSCHYSNNSIYRIWNFGDEYAPTCTTDTRNGINMNLNCNWSLDSTLIQHFYKPGKEGCYKVTLIMKDTALGCTDTAQHFLALTFPEVGYDTSVSPPKPRLKTDKSTTCLFSPTRFVFEDILPTCNYEKLWINVDSSCSALQNWILVDSLKNMREFWYNYQSHCDSSGWISVGLVIKNGECYDTAWYHRILRISVANPDFSAQLLQHCNPTQFLFTPIDTMQMGINSSIWNLFRIAYSDSISLPIDAYLNWPYDTGISYTYTSTIPVPKSFLLNSNQLSGLFQMAHVVIDSLGCHYRHESIFNLGYHGYFKASKTNVCIGDTLTLLDDIRYYDKSEPPERLGSRKYWEEPQRSQQNKEKIWWDIGDGKGFSITGSRPIVKYKNPGSYTIKMLMKDSNNCYDTFVRPGFINVTAIKANFLIMDSVYYCAPQIVRFIDSSVIIDSPTLTGIRPDAVINWSWDYGYGTQRSQLQHPSQLFPANGQYEVTLVATSSLGCVDSVSKPLKIEGPEPLFSIITDTIGCVPFEVQFSNLTSRNLLNWMWDFGDGNIASVSDKRIVVHSYQAPGIYEITLTGTDTIFNTTTQNRITCNARFPDTSFHTRRYRVVVLPRTDLNLTADDTICFGQQVTFKVKSNLITNRYHWSMSNILDTVTFHPDTFIVKKIQQIGTFLLTIIGSSTKTQACKDSVEKLLTVLDVKADFEIDKTDIPLVKFKNTSSDGATTFIWFFGHEGATATTQDGYFTYPQQKEDTFDVCLVASNRFGCTDTVCKPLFVGSRLVIPNVFTPDNKDNINDAFDIEIAGHNYYDLKIYNRWGVLVFETNKDGKGNDGINWNGKTMNIGEPCTSGVYYYIFNYQIEHEELKRSQQGTVTLIR